MILPFFHFYCKLISTLSQYQLYQFYIFYVFLFHTRFSLLVILFVIENSTDITFAMINKIRTPHRCPFSIFSWPVLSKFSIFIPTVYVYVYVYIETLEKISKYQNVKIKNTKLKLFSFVRFVKHSLRGSIATWLTWTLSY